MPRKNLKLLGGRPLIEFSIEEAKKARSLDYFLVSTDDDEIAEVSRNAGAPVPFKRPSELSEDKNGREVDTVFVAQNAVEWYEKTENRKVGFVCLLQPPSPFRQASDIDACVHLAKVTNADTVVSVARAKQNPFWALEVDSVTQQLRSFMDFPLEGDNLISQNLPLVYYPNGAVYVTKRDLIMNGKIYGNKIFGFTMPSERSIDVEDEADLIYASALLPQIKEKTGVWTKLSWIVS